MEPRRGHLGWLLLILLTAVGAVSVPDVRAESARSCFQTERTGTWRSGADNPIPHWNAAPDSSQISAAITEATVPCEPEAPAWQFHRTEVSPPVATLLAFSLSQRPPPTFLLR